MTVNRRTLLKSAGALAFLGLTHHVQAAVNHLTTDSLSWDGLPPMPFVAQEIYPAVFKGEIYVGGGFTVSDTPSFHGLAPSKDVAVFTPDNQTWRKGPSLPEARHHFGMASTGSHLFGIGGYASVTGNAWQAQKSVLKLDQNTQEWQQGPSLPLPLAESVYATVGQTIHVIGGRTVNTDTGRNVDTGKHYILTDQHKWEEAAPATIARNSAACAVHDGKIYVFGGRAYKNDIPNQQFAEVYDPKTDSWTIIRPLPVAMAGISASAFGGKIYIFGGEIFGPKGNWKAGKALNTVWCYDPAKDEWQQDGLMPTPRHGHGSVTTGDAIYIMGGAAKVGPQETLASCYKVQKS